MAIDTGTFVAGVGILLTLDVAVLAVAVNNARKLGHDPVARSLANDAETKATRANKRLTHHVHEDHDQ